jgi:hypothetical protein
LLFVYNDNIFTKFCQLAAFSYLFSAAKKIDNPVDKGLGISYNQEVGALPCFFIPNAAVAQ